MSPAPLPTTPLPLARIAETIHDAGAGFSGSTLVLVGQGAHDLTLGFWPIPVEARHPADVLVGWHAPAPVDALGLVTHGTAVVMPAGLPERPWFLYPAEAPPGSVRVTVLLGRDGTAASVIDRPDADPLAIHEAPEGWTADALARALGRPTPPPRVTLAECIEARWLDRIATSVFEEDRYPRTWADLARLHPLSPTGPALPGALLAVESRALDLESDWSRMRRLYGEHAHQPPAVHPPEGATVPLDRWFDDGSFARWTEQNLTPADLVLQDLLETLPESLGRELVDALTTVRPDQPWDHDDEDDDDRFDPDPPCSCWPPVAE